MRDMLGREIKQHDVVAYANNAGFMALGYVLEATDILRVIKRGYRNSPSEKVLMRPHDVIVVSEQADVADPTLSGRPEEIEFVQKLTDDKLVGELKTKLA